MTKPDYEPELVAAVARVLDDMEHLVAADSEQVARKVLDTLTHIRHGDPRMLTAVLCAELAYDQAVVDTLQEMAGSSWVCKACSAVLATAADDYAARVAAASTTRRERR